MLLHPTSLPGPFGVGDLGGEAYRFVDFLRESGQCLWQILPLGRPLTAIRPTSASRPAPATPCSSARNGWSRPACSTAPISILHNRSRPAPPSCHAPPGSKQALFEKVFARFGSDHPWRADFERFCTTHAWLDDYALFRALKLAHRDEAWHRWEPELARREPGALERARSSRAGTIAREKLWQYMFFRQWRDLRAHCEQRRVRIIGDMPIFVAYDSADVWARRDLFKLDESGAPTVVAGVPPDCFSDTGQLWGNPLYDWERMRTDGFRWWIDRMRATLELVDIVRVDHFRGFAACWEVPAHAPTAIPGRWVEVPGREMFFALQGVLGELPIIAEDLGVITPDVEALRDDFGFPGMRILQFAFDGDATNPHLPHHHVRNAIVYTGTHDNDTTVGWYAGRPGPGSRIDPGFAEHRRDYCRRYLHCDGREINWDFIRCALASVASVAIVPVQDLLGLDTEARMNTPAVRDGNWLWRLEPGQLTRSLGERLRALTDLYGRLDHG
ncbi:MAG: 4-alpha-glucanotransferase [Planctomycetota bacterium]